MNSIIIKKLTFIMLTMSLLVSSTINANESAALKKKVQKQIIKENVFKLIIANAVLKKQSGQIADLSLEGIEDAYQQYVTMNKRVASAAVTTAYVVAMFSISAIHHSLAKKSMKPVVELLAKISKSSGGSPNALINMIGSLFGPRGNNLTLPSSLTLSSGIGSSYGASEMLTSKVDTLLGLEEGRRMLGYSDEIKKQIDSVVANINSLFELNAEDIAIFKIKLQKEITKEIVSDNFSDNYEMNIDIYKILLDNDLITKNEHDASLFLNKYFILAMKSTKDQTPDDWKAIAQQLVLVKILSTMIESQLASGAIPEGPEKQKLLKIVFDVNQSIKKVSLLN